MNKKVIAKTSEIFAIFEPKALPIAILDLLSKLASRAINISGEDVAKPMNIKDEKK
tara:strand:- start:1823 stop:1990 length:168 start_codon:yes stop_codon:yes gene_type:complete